MMSRAAPVYLEFLARHAPAASCCSAAKDATPMYVTPTSLGGVTPARFHCAAFSPKADGLSPSVNNGILIDATPTPKATRTAACFHLAAFSKNDVELNARIGQRVHFQDPVGQYPMESSSGTPTLSEDRGSSKSTSMRSFSTCSFVTHLPSTDFAVKNTFIHVNSDEDDSDDDFYIPIQKSRSLPNASSLRSKNLSDVTGQLASGENDLESQASIRPRAQSLSLTATAKQGGLPSAGAKLHPDKCKPCAFFWKPEGCQNGVECYHCHACPQDEIRNRKKAKIHEFKEAKKLAKIDAAKAADQAKQL